MTARARSLPYSRTKPATADFAMHFHTFMPSNFEPNLIGGTFRSIIIAFEKSACSLRLFRIDCTRLASASFGTLRFKTLPTWRSLGTLGGLMKGMNPGARSNDAPSSNTPAFAIVGGGFFRPVQIWRPFRTCSKASARASSILPVSWPAKALLHFVQVARGVIRRPPRADRKMCSSLPGFRSTSQNKHFSIF
ncbi:hypothetical protein D3C81_1011250 [compost metagenome]